MIEQWFVLKHHIPANIGVSNIIYTLNESLDKILQIDEVSFEICFGSIREILKFPKNSLIIYLLNPLRFLEKKDNE